MRFPLPTFELSRVALATTLAALACLATASAQTPASTPASQPPAAAAPAAEAAKPAADAPDPEEEKEKSDKERRELERKGRRTERELVMARERLRKARLSLELAESAHKLSQTKAKEELELLQRKFKTFLEKSRPERLNRAELGLQMQQDGSREAEEELAQLEMMYKEDQFADKTKEIVLERGRRRLERARRSLEIETKAIELLKGETLPLEQLEQEIAIRDKQIAMERAVRDFEASMIDLKLAVMAGETEILRLEDELEDAHRDLASFDRKAAKKAKAAATASAPAK